MPYSAQPTPATMYMITEIHRNKIASAKLRKTMQSTKHNKRKYIRIAMVVLPKAKNGIVSPSGDDRGAKKRALQSCDHRALT